MPHPLRALANRLDQRRLDRRTRRDIKLVETDPHLARDIGVPHRPRTERRITLW